MNENITTTHAKENIIRFGEGFVVLIVQMSEAQILKHNDDPFFKYKCMFCIANDATYTYTYTYTNTYTITNIYTYNRVRFFEEKPDPIPSVLSKL